MRICLPPPLTEPDDRVRSGFPAPGRCQGPLTTLSAHGISADLPSGFEGRIFQRSAIGGEVARPVAHFATFPFPLTSPTSEAVP